MNQWQQFIAQQPSQPASENFICSADELGLILVTGDDARSFLQNQLSNDIDLIDETHFQLSAYSTPKGRMLGIFRVVQISNGYILLTPRTQLMNVMQRLHSFIVQSKVALADASEHFARFALHSSDPQVISNLIFAAQPGEVIQNDDLISLQLEPVAGQNRYLIFCLSADYAQSLWDELAGQLTITSFESWRLTEIKAGIPAIYPETAEEFVLQMSNLNLIGGVSFTKGCYPGQEIVARMQYLGKLKRRMFLARVETDLLPLPGDDIVAKGKDLADGSGKVVDAAVDPAGGCLCLYIAQIAKAEAAQLELLNQPGLEIANLELPYPIKTG